MTGVAALLCCVLPAILGAAGLGSMALAGWMETWEPVLIGLTLLLAALALPRALRRKGTSRRDPDKGGAELSDL